MKTISLAVFVATISILCGNVSGMSMSGSGAGLPVDDGDCTIYDRPEVPTTKEKELLAEMQCHLVCIEEVMESRNLTIQVSRTHPIWPAITDEALEQDCATYQQVQECRAGCVIMSNAKRLKIPNSDFRTCASLCEDNCQTSCEGMSSCPQAGTTCSRSCNNTNCERGCRLYSNIKRPMAALVPSQPPSPPLLTPPEVIRGAGRYRVSLSESTALRQGASEQDLHLTSFLFTVLQVDRNLEAHYWLKSLDDELNLEAFACMSDVIVIFFAVNRFGKSVSSMSEQVDVVYGDSDINMPHNPDPVLVQQVPDSRFGFWNHAQLQLSWTLPRGYSLLRGYRIRVAPETTARYCGQAIEINTTRNMQGVTIIAQEADEGPFNGCSYAVTVTSIPMSGSPVPAVEQTLNIDAGKVVPINFVCSRQWIEQDGTFRFMVSWMIPQFQPLLQAIQAFDVDVRLVKPHLEASGGDQGTLAQREVDFEASKSTYTQSLMPVQYDPDPEGYFSIQLRTIATSESNSAMALVPSPRRCQFTSVALPPQAVRQVRLDLDNVRYLDFDAETDMFELEVGVAWTRPQGRVSGYEVRLVEFVSGTGVGEVFALKAVTNAEQTDVVFTAMVPTDMPPSSCFYVQVRSVSPFMSSSNWSSPECILVSELTQPNTTSKPNSGKSSIVLYLVVGLGTGMLCITAILLMVMALACLHHRQRVVSKFESQPSFRKRLPSGSAFTPLTQQLCIESLPQEDQSHASPTSPVRPSVEEWELHPSQVLVETRLGHGTFGDVFKGMVRGGVGLYKSSGPLHLNGVAIKLLKTTGTSSDKESFLNHIEQAKLVAKEVYSKHLCRMIGCVTLFDPLCLVMELPANGDLLTYLVACRKEIFAAKSSSTSNGTTNTSTGMVYPSFQQLHRCPEPQEMVGAGEGRPSAGPSGTCTGRRPSGPDSGCKLTVRELLTYAAQIASGMECLSSNGIVHGDLACRNVYLNQHMQVKISDLSLNTGDKSRGGSRLYITQDLGRLPVKWLPPEALSEGEFSVASDVWAYGVTLWEIVTLGGLPYNGMRNKDVLGHLCRGHRLDKPENCSQEVYEILRSCWDDNAQNRPSFKALKEAFTEFNTRQAFHTPPLTLEIFPESLCYRIISNSRRRTSTGSEGRGKPQVNPPGGGCEGQGQVQEVVALEVVEDEEEGAGLEREREEEESGLNTGKLTAYSYLPRIDEDDEEEEEEMAEQETALTNNLHIILATPEQRSRSPSQIDEVTTTSNQSLIAVDRISTHQRTVAKRRGADREDTGEADTSSDSESSESSSDENTANVSVDTTSLCLQSSAETVAERATSEPDREASAEMDKDLGQALASAKREMDAVSDQAIRRDVRKKSIGVSEVAIELDEECPSDKCECVGKDCGSSEEVQERAYQALL